MGLEALSAGWQRV